MIFDTSISIAGSIVTFQFLWPLFFPQPQHNLPDVFIWMIAGSKRVAYTRLPSARVIYAEDNLARGQECGQRMNLFLQNPNDSVEIGEIQDYNACKIDVFLWLGNAKFATACWSAIPPGYEVDDGKDLDVFPRFFKYNQFSVSSSFRLCILRVIAVKNSSYDSAP